MGKIVLAGGTGFIGSYIQQQYQAGGHQVVVISRSKPNVQWKDEAAIRQALEGADLLVNLAGKSVDCRYNEANKKAIMESRTRTTATLGRVLGECNNPPPLWLNSSTATIYRDARDRPQTEADGEIGSGFSVNVAKAWEKEFFQSKLPAVQQIALRIAIVLGPGGGVMTPYKNLVKFGLGGRQGDGKQMFSWIHIEDLFRIIEFLRENTHLAKPPAVVNCAAPNPVTNTQLMRNFREVMGAPFGLPAAKWMLEIGAVMLQTETELILKSRWVLPERLQQAGFQFQYPELRAALKAILAADSNTRKA